jgi:hypothetical protein
MVLPVLLALLQPGSAATPTAPTPTAPAKAAAKAHPIITEVLYAVPKDGDADQDGTRSATGDEFIELVNPTDKAINLKGYTLSNGKSAKATEKSPPKADPKPDAKGGKSGDKPKGDSSGHRPDESRIRFTFPELTLQPGEVVVVFNGYESHTPGPVGDASAAAGKNEKFSNAYVLSMHCTSQYQALANAGDCVLLTDPDGNALECVLWGNSDKKPEKDAPVVHKVECGLGSVQRTSATGEFVRHQDLPAPYGGAAWSPGRFGEKK